MLSDRSTAGRPWSTALGIVAVAAAMLMGLAAANAEEGPAGITQRTAFPAFDPNAPACNPPPGLAKVLAFVQENEREFLQGVDHGLAAAAKDRGLEYRHARCGRRCRQGCGGDPVVPEVQGRRSGRHVVRSGDRSPRASSR